MSRGAMPKRDRQAVVRLLVERFKMEKNLHKVPENHKSNIRRLIRDADDKVSRAMVADYSLESAYAEAVMIFMAGG